jgi:hypothetical protein
LTPKIRRFLQIKTSGQPIPGVPFMGETMICSLCGKVKKSDPAVESNWERLSAGGVNLYYCTKHELPEKIAHFDAELRKRYGARYQPSESTKV